MKKIIAVILMFIFCAFPVFSGSQSSAFYVDYEIGNDDGIGSKEEPFKTLKQAQMAVRKINRFMTSDIYIYINEGTHYMDETLLLDARDSGENGYNIIYKGENRSRLSGGVKVFGWELYDEEKNIYKAPANGIYTEKLYVNGETAVRARSEGGMSNVVLDNGSVGFTTTDKFLADFKYPDELMIVFHSEWTNPMCAVDAIIDNGDNVLVKMAQPIWDIKRNAGQTAVKEPWYYENAFELLDSPGEWYLDIHEDSFYYIPKEEAISAVVPLIEEIIRIEGKNLNDIVRNIKFENIEFEHTAWNFVTENRGLDDGQNMIDTGVYRPAGLSVMRAHGIDIKNCKFSQMGSQGLQMLHGVKNCVITGNEFTDIAAGAVTIGAVDSNEIRGTNSSYIVNPRDKRYIMEYITFKNNYIHRVGKTYRSTAAVTLGFVANSKFEHNEIAHVPYSGISVGWGWDTVSTSSSYNLSISYNYFYDMLAELHDGGAVYLLGGSGGSDRGYENLNIIRENYAKNFGSGTAPLYSDNGAAGYLWERNVIDMHDGIFQGFFAFLNEFGRDVYYNENYTTSNLYKLYSDEAWVRNTHHYPDANWNDEAIKIIQNSGLEKEYEHMSIKNILCPIDNVIINEKTDIEINESIDLNCRVFSEKARPIKADSLEYASSDVTVAEISSEGIVTGKKTGKAQIHILAKLGDYEYLKSVDIHVNDDFKEISFDSGFSSYMTVGTERALEFSVKTLLGNTMKLVDINIKTDNSEVIEDIGNGKIKAVGAGNAKIICSGIWRGEFYERSYDVSVISHSNESGLDFPAFSMDNMLKSTKAWKTNGDATVSKRGNSLEFVIKATEPNSAYYIDEKFKDQLFTTTINVSDMTSGWCAILLRGQNTESWLGDLSAYSFTFNARTFELQRFVNGERTVIFGNAPGTNIGGGLAPNPDILVPGKTHQIQVGAINEENGVRLIFNVDGKNVMYFLDDTNGRIENQGYFGLMSFNGPVLFYSQK